MNKSKILLVVIFLLLFSSLTYAQDFNCSDFVKDFNSSLKDLEEYYGWYFDSNSGICDNQVCQNIIQITFNEKLTDNRVLRCLQDFNKVTLADDYNKAISTYDKLIEKEENENNKEELLNLLENEYGILSSCGGYLAKLIDSSGLCDKQEQIKEKFRDLFKEEYEKRAQSMSQNTSCHDHVEFVSNFSSKLVGIDTKMFFTFNNVLEDTRKDVFFDAITCGQVCTSQIPEYPAPEDLNGGLICYDLARKLLPTANLGKKGDINQDPDKILNEIDINSVALAKAIRDEKLISDYSFFAGKSAYALGLKIVCGFPDPRCEDMFEDYLDEISYEDYHLASGAFRSSIIYFADSEKTKDESTRSLMKLKSTIKIGERKKVYMDVFNSIQEIFLQIYGLIPIFILISGFLLIVMAIIYVFRDKISFQEYTLKIEPLIEKLPIKDYLLLLATLWVGTTIGFTLSLSLENTILMASSTNDVNTILYLANSNDLTSMSYFSYFFKDLWNILGFSFLFGVVWLFSKGNKWLDPIYSMANFFSFLAFGVFLLYLVGLMKLEVFFSGAFLLLITGLIFSWLLMEIKARAKAEKILKRRKYIQINGGEPIHVPTCGYLNRTDDKNKKEVDLSKSDLKKYRKCTRCIKDN
ncbi:MAG: hypothetical protein ABID38_04720 [Candidatus Diapherotrites archaeon]